MSHAAITASIGTASSTGPGLRRCLRVVLSGNPLRVPPDELSDLEVLVTIKEGVPIYQQASE